MKKKTKLPKIYSKDYDPPTIPKLGTIEKVIELLENAQANLHERAKLWMNITGHAQLSDAIRLLKDIDQKPRQNNPQK